MTVCPTSQALALTDVDFHCVMRMRLGLAVCLDGPDPHGYHRLADNLGGRTNARHKVVVASWRQVFVEAGGEVPDRNVERLLRNTWIPVADHNQQRMDLVVNGLNVQRGLPLFCDVTVVSPLSHRGLPRPGTSNYGGSLLTQARRDNDATYTSVTNSGLGALYCLGFEVFGRWGKQCIDLVPILAREKSRGMHPRLRRGTALAYQQRWTGVVAVGLMKAVAAAALHGEGADLSTALLEPEPSAGDLPVM